MTAIQYTKVKGENLDKMVRAKVYAFIEKLTENDEAPGLRIKPMHGAADPTARTGRVDKGWRDVLYRIDRPGQELLYVYAGTWEHDEAIERARTRVLRTNPINGIAEFIRAREEPKIAPPRDLKAVGAPESASFLAERSFLKSELVSDLGFSEEEADELFNAASEDEILAISERFENVWQMEAALGLAAGDNVAKIREDLGVTAADAVGIDQSQNAEMLADALQRPASKMQFTLVENNEELRRILDGGDFGAWRVFLHPEQRAYAERDYNGAFRLTGGAGTGKTVVLLHRTRRLATTDPNARIVLTTFTKALSSALERDLKRLDPELTMAAEFGATGVLVRGIDALASTVKTLAGPSFWTSAAKIFGNEIDPRSKTVGSDDLWERAVSEANTDLPSSLTHKSFLEAEYVQVILPNRCATRNEYFGVRRPGRGVALDRKKRAAIWTVVERYRQIATDQSTLSYPEIAAIAAAYLEQQPSRFADHVLIDEAQDLTPLHWQLLRALGEVGPNDLFIAEDTHQRIYGHQVILSRYGIAIRGRSRRLTLNYRTTQQNLGFALDVLKGGEYENSEEGVESTHGYRSARSGPVPVAVGTETEEDAFDTITMIINGWIDEGVVPSSIAVLARTNPARDTVKARLADRDLNVYSSDSGEPHSKLPVTLTMHKSKGQEFSHVILFDVSEGTIPAHWMLKGLPEEEVADAKLRERSLLYVAASRARDGLVIVWTGKPSELLGSVTGEN